MTSAAAVSSVSVVELAIMLRRRLNALRKVDNVRETLRHTDDVAKTLGAVPRVSPLNGWGGISSWGNVEEKISNAFRGEKLVFIRPGTQNPGDVVGPNTGFSVEDGEGGTIVRVALLKGDWDKMLAASGLADLE